MALVAIDPGKVTGIAIFDGSDPDQPYTGIDRLKYASICSVEECRGIVESAAPLRFLHKTNLSLHGDCIIEVPQIYPGQQQKGDQNDLIDLAVTVGRYAEQAQSFGFRVTLVKPRAWKGQLPKDVCWQRVRETLTPVEIKKIEQIPKSKAHNMHDAIGLGTWFQKRWR